MIKLLYTSFIICFAGLTGTVITDTSFVSTHADTHIPTEKLHPAPS